MILPELRIDGFGKLKGEVRFAADRINVLVGPNEAGKTTLATAIAAALYGLDEDRRSYRGRLTPRPLLARNALDLVRRRARAAGIRTPVSNHTFRATGITAYLENGGTLEGAQAIAAHESPRTTKLYDRTADRITLDEIERIIL